MHDLTTSPTGIVALAGAAVAVLALLLAAAASLRIRRLRQAQLAVLGDERQDLVSHAATLQQEFRALHDYMEDAASRLHERMDHAEQRLDGSIAYRALVRYDAYNEMSGRQSTSIALLDASRSGVVLSSIHHRDSTRLYAKQVRDGRGELELSPEEEEAVQLALAAGGANGAGPAGA